MLKQKDPERLPLVTTDPDQSQVTNLGAPTSIPTADT